MRVQVGADISANMSQSNPDVLWPITVRTDSRESIFIRYDINETKK